jgi:hypothetical protein
MASASATTRPEDKTVTGYPAQSSQVAAGYPAGTAYAYVAPRPTSYTAQTYGPGPAHNNNYYQRRTRPSFLCRLIIIASAVFAIMGIVFFIAWLILKPRLPEFRVDSASVSQLNVTSSSELTATWNFTLFVRNPNTKLNLYYDRLQASVSYGRDDILSMTSLQPFFQPKRNETRVLVRFSVVDEYVREKVATRISDEKAIGSVGFRVRVIALVKFRSGIWWTRQRLLRVYCDRVQIGFGSNNGTGSLTGQSVPCEVDL